MCCVHHSIMSPCRRTAASIGKHHSFCAMYSLRMSAWIVPASCSGATPCASAADDEEGEHDRRRSVDRHRHADLTEIDPREQVLHVVERVDRDALAADLADG